MSRTSKFAMAVVDIYHRNSGVLRPLLKAAIQVGVVRDIRNRILREAYFAPVDLSTNLDLHVMRHRRWRRAKDTPTAPDNDRAELCLKVWRLTPARPNENPTANSFASTYIVGQHYRCPVTRAPISVEGALAFLYLSAQPRFASFFRGTALQRKIDEATQLPFMEGENSVAALDDISPLFIEEMRSSPFGSMLATLIRSEPLRQSLEATAEAMTARAFIGIFPSLIIFFRDMVRYDDLKQVIEFYIDWFNGPRGRHIAKRDCKAFIETLVVGLKNLNGRSISSFPKVPISRMKTILDHNLARSYFRLALGSLQYEVAAKILNGMEGISPLTLIRLGLLTNQHPFKVERDAEARKNIRSRIAEQLRSSLAGIPGLPAGLPDLAFHVVNSDASGIREAISVVAGNAPYRKEALKQSSLTSIIAAQIIRLRILEEEEIRVLWPLMTPADVEICEFRLRTSQSPHDVDLEPTPNEQPALTQLKHKLAGSLAWKRSSFMEAYHRINTTVVPDDKLENRVAVQTKLERLRFLDQTSRIINSMPQPSDPAGVALLASLNCFNTLALVGPILVELKRQGYAVGSLLEGVLDSPGISGPAGSLFNCAIQDRTDGNVELDWHVDWPARLVEACGVNFYQGIYERLSTKFRRATITLDDAVIKEQFDHLLRSSDYMLRKCLEVEAVAKSTSQPIILIGSNSHVSPYSVIRDFALSRDLPNLRYVSASVAYENYYSNLGSKYSGSMAVVDMTLHKTCRAPFLAIRPRFEKWYRANRKSEEIDRRFDLMINENRNRRLVDIQAPAHERILEARKVGRRVVCCLGKVPCDLAVPYDGGPAHIDMTDWLNHSIESVAGTDTLLLIKPHPHELRPEIALDLTERLEDLISSSLPENVIVLGHTDYNVNEIAGLIDLAVLWNGTSCLELTGLGIPVVMCSHFGRHDYPVDLHYPVDREHYSRMLTQEHMRPPSKALRRKAMGLLHYMGTEDVALPNTYSRRPITNDNVGIPKWDEAKLSELIVNGDPYVTIAVDRVLEGIPAMPATRQLASANEMHDHQQRKIA
jgi:capsular polysaccharide export protein